jgi:hypothetical protein
MRTTKIQPKKKTANKTESLIRKNSICVKVNLIKIKLRVKVS